MLCRLDNLVLEKIVQGNQTFQGAFMSGSMTAKGNFKTSECWISVLNSSCGKLR